MTERNAALPELILYTRAFAIIDLYVTVIDISKLLISTQDFYKSIFSPLLMF